MAESPRARSAIWTLPNQLTLSRLGMAILLFLLIALEWWLGCLMVFLLAAFTDWLDGYVARKFNLSSALGRNLDPLVDKVLVCGCYVFLLPLGHAEGWLWPWMVTLVLGRELIITGLRSFLESHGNLSFGADWLGKAKMVLQSTALIAIFVSFPLAENWPDSTRWFSLVRDGLIYAMLIATLGSGIQYLWKASSLLSANTKLS